MLTENYTPITLNTQPAGQEQEDGSIHCIKRNRTGEGIWQLSGEISPGAMADGYLTASNSWDGYMYVSLARGLTATTVTASPKK